MGLLSGCVKRILKLFLYLTIFVVTVLLIPNLPPYKQFTSIQLDPAQPRTGALAPNDILNNPEKLYKGKLHSPEAFDVHNGEVYTGLATGEIVKLSPGGHVTFVTKLGKPCAGLHEEHICGRPLGLQIDKTNNQLYAADAYYGIWKIDLKTNKKELLVSPDVEINGNVPRLFNDLAIDRNGDVYWTDSSTDFQLKDGAHTILMDPSGRLLHYNADKKVNTVLADKLGFANGIVMSPDHQFVLVVETMLLKVTKYYINGPKKGSSEVFVTGLPGMPDNIRALPDGSGVLLSLYTVYDDEHPLITNSLLPLPCVRKFLVRTVLMIENLFDFLNKQIPHPIFESIVFNLGNFKGTSGLLSGNAGLLQIDWNGNIVASYFSTDKNVFAISDAIVVNDKLWTGSPHSQDYIAAYPVPPLLKKAFAPVKPTAEIKTNEKVVEKVQIKEKVVEKKEALKTTAPPPAAEPKTKKIDEGARQPPSQPPAKPKTTTQQPEKKPLDNKEAKTTSKETPKQNVATKATAGEANVNPNKDSVKPAVAAKESDTKKKVVTETQQKIVEDKAKTNDKQTEKPKADASSPNKPSSAQTKKAPQDAKPAATSNTEAKKAPQGAKTAAPSNTEAKKAPKTAEKSIPVVEDIPSDTVKPTKEKLKVITKSGPNVIPNPNL